MFSGLDLPEIAALKGVTERTIQRHWRSATITPRGVVMAVGIGSFVAALGLALRVEEVGLPTAEEVSRRFLDDDDDAA